MTGLSPWREGGRHSSVIAADETIVAHCRASSPINFVKSCRERILGSIPSLANCACMSDDFNPSLIAARRDRARLEAETDPAINDSTPERTQAAAPWVLNYLSGPADRVIFRRPFA
jgi:hypothetical protein